MIGGMMDWIEHFRGAAKGLVVAHVWRGYGSALFVEFGALTPTTRMLKDGRPSAPSGEIGLMIEADWRIENACTIVCGSGSDEKFWKPTFASLIGKHVVNVETFGRLPEILVSLSDGFHVASFSTLDGNPLWTFFDRRSTAPITVHCRAGAIIKEQASPAQGVLQALSAGPQWVERGRDGDVHFIAKPSRSGQAENHPMRTSRAHLRARSIVATYVP